ncbi:MAG: SPOR domain-containing protein [Phaeodactylibacter sp.]|nr:SPOR domain-containing protein [Phaeodactylibacter sp.]
MARFLFLGWFLVFGQIAANAQNNVFYEEDRPIGEMMDRFIEINKSRNYVSGWRVQVLATPDRQRLESVKQSFQYRYPSIAVDWVHSAPYYKLRAGAFATKLEALRLKYILERDYPGIYLVRDDAIRPRELIGGNY